MQFNTLPTLALLVSSHFCLKVAANSAYAASCNSIYIYSPEPPNTDYWTISANCAMEDGVYNVGTEINIDSCFVNAGGTLVAQLG
jgi:hypothetical protein